MTLPTFRAAGAKADNNGAVTPALPTGVQIGDICILVATTITGGSASITTAGGGAWTALIGSPIDPSGGGERLYVWWRRHASGDSAPTVTPGSDHCCAGIAAWYGCIASGDPINVTATGTDILTNTTLSFATGISTTVNDCMVLLVSSTGADTNTAQHSAQANANLSSIAERMDYNTNSGGGGGFECVEGGRAAAGAIGTWTATLATASAKAYISFALKPVPSGTTYEVSATFSASGALTDSNIMTISASTPMTSSSGLSDSNVASMNTSLSLPSNSLVSQGNAVIIEVSNVLNASSLISETGGLAFDSIISLNGISAIQESCGLEINPALNLSASGNFAVTNLLELLGSLNLNLSSAMGISNVMAMDSSLALPSSSLVSQGNAMVIDVNHTLIAISLFSSLKDVILETSLLFDISSLISETGGLAFDSIISLNGISAIQESCGLEINPALNLSASGNFAVTNLLELLGSLDLHSTSLINYVYTYSQGTQKDKLLINVNGKIYMKLGKMTLKL